MMTRSTCVRSARADPENAGRNEIDHAVVRRLLSNPRRCSTKNDQCEKQDLEHDGSPSISRGTADVHRRFTGYVQLASFEDGVNLDVPLVPCLAVASAHPAICDKTEL